MTDTAATLEAIHAFALKFVDDADAPIDEESGLTAEHLALIDRIIQGESADADLPNRHAALHSLAEFTASLPDDAEVIDDDTGLTAGQVRHFEQIAVDTIVDVESVED